MARTRAAVGRRLLAAGDGDGAEEGRASTAPAPCVEDVADVPATKSVSPVGGALEENVRLRRARMPAMYLRALGEPTEPPTPFGRREARRGNACASFGTTLRPPNPSLTPPSCSLPSPITSPPSPNDSPA